MKICGYALVLVLYLAAVTSGDYKIAWSTIDGGGGRSAGGKYLVRGTIGQPDAEYSSGGSYELSGGFWNGVMCTVDFGQFSSFAEEWLERGSNLPADLNHNGVVDIYDLKLFVDEWLCVCPYNWPLR